MGGILITREASGKTVEEAFRKVQEEDRLNLGEDYYNGGINNCTLVAEESRDLDILNSDDIYKGDAHWMCTNKPKPNENKIKTFVINYPQKGTRKWITYYEIRDNFNNYIGRKISQTEAIKFARKHQENYPERSYKVHIVKVLENGNTKVADIKYKPSTTEKDGRWKFKAIAPY